MKQSTERAKVPFRKPEHWYGPSKPFGTWGQSEMTNAETHFKSKISNAKLVLITLCAEVIALLEPIIEPRDEY